MKEKRTTMKSTGMVRPIDKLGRVVLPKELRKHLGMQDGDDSVEVFIEGKQIVMQKYEPGCIFCKNVKDVVELEGKKICPECMAKIAEKRRTAS